MCFGAVPAYAAGTGIAKGVNPQADAQTPTELRQLTVGADVFIGDRIITGPEGQVQIKFADQTELVVGPRSSLVIEDYLLRSDNSAGKFVINALTGSFRFATGNAEKDRYVIKTPTGTIGIRGTALDINVEDETTRVLLFHGAVIMCNLANKCVTLDDTCALGEYDTSDSVVLGDAKEMDDETKETLLGLFPYADSQDPLLREFWVDRARQCLHEPMQASTSSLAGPSDSSVDPFKPEEEEEPGCESECEGECPG
jgi:hypothetical protein